MSEHVELEVIVKMIIYKCRELGSPVTETLAAYVAQTTISPKTKKFYMEAPVSEEDARELVEKVVKKLLDANNQSIDTIRLQIGYDSAYVQQEFHRQQTITNLSHESNRLIDEIVSFEPKNGNDFEGITTLYRKIYNYLLYKNKQHIIGGYSSIQLTPSINNTVEREVAAALESVLPRAGLRPFVSLSTAEKVAQLCELSNIVIGIRLFNRDIGKGGIGLESFNDILTHPSRNLINELNKEITEIMESSDNYTIFFSVLDDLPSEKRPTKEDIARYRDELTYKRQFLIYILELKSDVQLSEQNIENLHGRYSKEISELKDLIGNKTSIPKDQVYPKFDALSQIYSQLLEEKYLGVLRKELFKVLNDYKEKSRTTLIEDLVRECKLLYIQRANIQREEETKVAQSTESSVVKNQILRLMPNSTPDFMHIPLDYLGFCLYTIVKKDGLLMPGKPNLGVLKFKEKYCVFSEEKAVSAFIEEPEEFLETITHVCRLHPELIHLLKLQEEFPEASLASLLQGKDGTHPLFSVSAPLMVDKGVDTPTHFVERHIQPDYHWNEWELRKKALQMANIRKKQTVSVQTVLSNFRRENETQTWLPKEGSTNTGINKSTMIGQEKTYIVGLRDKDVK